MTLNQNCQRANVRTFALLAFLYAEILVFYAHVKG